MPDGRQSLFPEAVSSQHKQAQPSGCVSPRPRLAHSGAAHSITVLEDVQLADHHDESGENLLTMGATTKLSTKLRDQLIQGYTQDENATGMEPAVTTAAVGISSPSSRPQPRHSLEETPLIQRLEVLRAKLTAPAPERKTESVANSATQWPQELMESPKSAALAQAASPGPSPELTCTPAKKARRLVPNLPIACEALESRSGVGNQKTASHHEVHQDLTPAANHTALPSVFSFL